MKTYLAMCKLLSCQDDQVVWDSFSNADWETLTNLACAEGVAPLLHTILTRSQASGTNIPIPVSVNQQFAHSYFHNAAYNALLCRELDGVMTALGNAGVPVILLKGAALIKTLYADPAERVMNDLDILVRRNHLPQAVRTLKSAGFQRLMDNYLRYHVLMLGGQAGEVTLELHWSLVFNERRFPEMIDWFWSQCLPLDPDIPGVFTLSPTAYLLYQAAHLALQHAGEARLGWYYDLYLLINRSASDSAHGIDWDALLARAVQFTWARALLDTLTAVQARFDCTLEEEFLERLNERAALESDQAKKLVGAASDGRSRSLVKVWNGLDWPDRLGMLRGLLFPRPAYLRWRYHPRPRWLWPLFYMRRCIEIVLFNKLSL